MNGNILTLGTSVEQHLGDKSEQEVLEKAGGEFEVGPVVTIFESLQSIALEVNFAIEVLLIEDNHGNFALSTVSGAVMLTVELQVVLDGEATVLGLLGLARRNGGRDSPKSDQDRDASKDSKEDGGVETSTDLACQPPGDHQEQSNQQAIGEAVAAGRIGGNGGILDGRVLEKRSKLAPKPKYPLVDSSSCELTRVVGTPQSKSGLVCSGAAGV
jgi:hypothetical protein